MFFGQLADRRNLYIGRVITAIGDQIELRDCSIGVHGWRLDVTPSGSFDSGNAGTAACLMTDRDLVKLHGAVSAALVSAGLLGATRS